MKQYENALAPAEHRIAGKLKNQLRKLIFTIMQRNTIAGNIIVRKFFRQIILGLKVKNGKILLPFMVSTIHNSILKLLTDQRPNLKNLNHGLN